MITVKKNSLSFGSIGGFPTSIIFKLACFGSAARVGGFPFNLNSFYHAEPKRTRQKNPVFST